MLSISEASFLSTTLEGIIYGFSVLMFIFTIWILIQNRRRKSLNKSMILLSCALMLLSTFEMVDNIIRLQQGFMSIGPHMPGGSEQYFADVSQPTYVIKSVVYDLQTLILDSAVIYRAYVVWRRVDIVILPALTWLGLLVCCIGTTRSFAIASTQASNLFAAEMGRWITASYSLTLSTNVVATSLVAYKIWTVQRESKQLSSTSSLTPILYVIIESGVLYSVTIICALITYVNKSNGVYVILDMISPIISIVFNMIIVRVGLARTQTLVGSTTVQSRPTYPIQARDGYRGHPIQDNANITVAAEITQFIASDAYATPASRGSDGVSIELKDYPGAFVDLEEKNKKM